MKEVAIRKTQVALQQVGDREVSFVGWRTDLATEHFKSHLGRPDHDSKWCEIECLARTFYGRNSPENRRKARRNLTLAFKMLLSEGVFLVIEYANGAGTHGEATACKIMLRDTCTPQEEQAAGEQLRRMERRKELTVDQLKQAWNAIGGRK